MRLVIAAALAGFAVASFASGPAGAEEAAGDAGFDAGAVLATVNGVEITLGHAIVMRDRLPMQYQALPDEVLMKGIVDQLVDQTLLAAKESVDPASDPLEVRLHVENERRGTLAARQVQAALDAPIEAAAVEAAYAERMASFEPATEYNAAHILVASEEEAQAARARIEAGEDFAEVAKELSGDPGSGPQGGGLGWFGLGMMVPEFEAAVVEMEPGALSEPVRTQFGWHIVKLNETRQSSAPSFEAMQAEIENELRQERLEAEVAALRAAATIEIPEGAVPPEAIRRSDLVRN